MKKTSRKRLLVSSVAMMMVATVSLGSATYAWFTQQPTATASYMSIATNKSSGIVVKTEDATKFTTASEWNDTRLDVKLNPASILMTGTATNNGWYIAPKATIEGAAQSTSQVSDTLAGVPAAYALKTNFQVKTLDETTEKTVSCQVTAANGNTVYSYIRVAVVDHSNNTVLGVYSTDDTSKTTSAVTSAADDTSFTTGDYTSVSTSFTLGKVSTARTFDVYVWLEGQDPDCVDPTAQTIESTDISFTLTDTDFNK